MQYTFTLSLFFLAVTSYGQEALLKKGDPFPDLVIKDISNAPVKEFYLNGANDDKYYVLNFWGTWCSPCLPEMDSLAKLQVANADRLQVIALSDDVEERKQKYLEKKPSGLWLATDTTYTLYNMLKLAYVGQSAIIDPQRRIVALVKTDAIDQGFIDQLLAGDSVLSNAEIRELALNTSDDPFGVDSLLTSNFTIRSYMHGQQAMGRFYPNGPFEKRRHTFYNTSIRTLYRTAFDIHSANQELFDTSVSKTEVSDYENKNTLYCVDLLVAPTERDSLYAILRAKLNQSLSIKARQEERELDVYVLKGKTGAPLELPRSTAEKSSYSFSGRGYDGQKVTLADFAANYLSNELGLPVVDETGLDGFFDIKTTVNLRTNDEIEHSIARLGLEVEKTKRKMPVIVYYK